MVSEAQQNRASAMIAEAEAQTEGAAVATGGRKMNIPVTFLERTIADEGVSGPVLSALKFTSDEEAMNIASGMPCGLVGGVLTSNLDRATTAARQLRAGKGFVNEWHAGGVETPFGGCGKSGYGREKGREA